MEKKLTEREAYLAMFAFLEEYYKLTKKDEIGSLLSSMCLMPDSFPIDSAIWGDWEKAVRAALENAVDAEVRFVTTDNTPE